MKKYWGLILVATIFLFIGWFLNNLTRGRSGQISITGPVERITKPLEKYTIENLSNTKIDKGKIKIVKIIDEESSFTSYLFSFEFNPDPKNKKTKKTTGQINVPAGSGKFPLVVMLRGYVDQEKYKTGDGTKSATRFFAENGFLTIAPDFLGYGDSDTEAEDIMETRFQTYTTILSLLESLDQIDEWDKENVFFWGHSNGGQIALTVLEITGANIPTTLWAPVSKPFPYSVLYYTDEAEDRGKFLRAEIAKFEQKYDPDNYAIDLNFDLINSELQIHQGTADDAVPVDWSNELVEKLEDLEIEISYYKYPGADHNLKPSWNTVVNRDLAFFKNNLN